MRQATCQPATTFAHRQQFPRRIFMVFTRTSIRNFGFGNTGAVPLPFRSTRTHKRIPEFQHLISYTRPLILLLAYAK